MRYIQASLAGTPVRVKAGYSHVPYKQFFLVVTRLIAPYVEDPKDLFTSASFPMIDWSSVDSVTSALSQLAVFVPESFLADVASERMSWYPKECLAAMPDDPDMPF